MQEQANPIITSLFTDVLQNTVISGLLIVAIIFLAKFIKQSNLKGGKILFLLGYAYLGKELLITLSALVKSIFVTIVQAMISGSATPSTSLLSVYQKLNEYNVWFIVALVIVIGLFFVFKPNLDAQAPVVASEDVIKDEEIKVTNFETSNSKVEEEVAAVETKTEEVKEENNTEVKEEK